MKKNTKSIKNNTVTKSTKDLSKSNSTKKTVDKKKEDVPVFKSKNVFLELESVDPETNNDFLEEDTSLPSNNSKKNTKNIEEVKVTKIVDFDTNVQNLSIEVEKTHDNSGWTVQGKKGKVNRKKLEKNNIDSDNSYDEFGGDFDIDVSEKEEVEETEDTGEHLKFLSKWNVWIHLNNSTNWAPESYNIVYTINNMSSFWKFVNNIHNLNFDKYHFYVMKDNSCPTWEHPTNRNGGTCSIRLPKDRIEDVIEQLSILVVNDTFNDSPNEINGISFGIKQNWGLIKIWNSNYEHDISSFVPQYLTKKYSATPRYKKNEPEY